MAMEISMPTFGFSAFLKLICLNDRPSRTQLRSRLQPGPGGGYDFHRSLRLRAHRYLVDGEPMEAVAASVREIVRAPEQNSARIGLDRLEAWRREHPGAIIPFTPATYESPTGLFKVTFTPDFGVRLGRDGVAVHVWNTAKPDLSPRMVYAALSLFPALYAEGEMPPDDLAVLSLREPQLYRLSEAGRYAGLGASLASRLEDLLRQVREEIGLPPTGDKPDDRPPRP
jgi:hypothetical protein